ncbi:GDSL-type esterase/lipase family protein [Sphingomonas sp. BAUL-RG-20F-R05-02]|uniref:GDSL-type esterase/lipase family protein n=1 Tax=Sphingomonas sp. BAUL-RG-20F-R05-02 TaxID=2914830 RepID=UPI001F560E20|nr:GDSL-type esterase/lipase family protein [Sphingomonas sp. BAUL-RG-20F-R05-02]
MTASAPLILAFGDSLVAGYGLATADGFAAQLEHFLSAAHPGARVINAGVAGNTTADALRRLPRVLARLLVRPDLAIVQLGPNDVLREVPPSSTLANLEAILVEFGRCGVPVLLTTVVPPPLLAQRAGPYADIQQALAKLHGATTWPFFPAGVLGHRDMVLADRVHPNGKAIAAVVEAMLPAIEGILNVELTR